jgi:hypothetical protein
MADCARTPSRSARSNAFGPRTGGAEEGRRGRAVAMEILPVK